MNKKSESCPDGGVNRYNRRDFVRATAVGTIAASSSLASHLPTLLADDKKKKPASETLVTQLFKSMTDDQKKGCTFSFDDPLRSKVDNNWFITKSKVRAFNADQQALIKDIFMGLHSEQYGKDVLKQVEHDNRQGFGDLAVAMFGKPGNGKFEMVISGRHVTRRCDGNSVEGAAFGGPIFYGHASASFNEPPDHPGNVYWFQAKRANELFQALDGKQRKVALLGTSRGETGNATVKLAGKATELAGLPVTDMSADQKELAEKVMEDLLAPFRKEDRDECMKLIGKNGFDKLHLSYYKNEDIGDDGVWDVWQVEGPSMIWYFRGKPHVHTWVHIRDSA